MKNYIYATVLLFGAIGCSGPSVANIDQIKKDLVGQTIKTDIKQRSEWLVEASEIKEVAIAQRFTDAKTDLDEVHVSIMLSDGKGTAKGDLVLTYKKYEQGWRLEGLEGILPGSGAYTDNGTTVTDNYTRLMWVKDGDSAGCNNEKTMKWKQAVAFCEDLTYADFSDWRLPDSKEVSSLVNPNESPALDSKSLITRKLNVFGYWTSTTVNDPLFSPDAPDDCATAIHFDAGERSHYRKSDERYVCCVRSAP